MPQAYLALLSGTQADLTLALLLRQQLLTFPQPVLLRLDSHLDRRLVRSPADVLRWAVVGSWMMRCSIACSTLLRQNGSGHFAIDS